MAIIQQLHRQMGQGHSLPLPAVVWPAALHDHDSLALIYPEAPCAERYLQAAAAAQPATPQEVIGHFDPKPVILPWLSVVQNLVFGTRHAAASQTARDILALLDLSSVARRRASCLGAEAALYLALARAMLRAPGLLVLSDLARHPAVLDLRNLARIESGLGHLTGCRRLHLCSSVQDATIFCDLFLPATP